MTDHADLERWLLATAQGDQRAFRKFYEATAAHLYPVALRILREDGRASDCVQDAFVKIWVKAADYEPGRSPMAWAAAIVRYQAIDMLRRLPKDLPDWEEVDWEHHVGTEVPESRTLPGQRQILADCLRALPQDQRQAIAQAFFRAATYEEVASYTGTALGTVKSWIRRGLLALRDCIDHGAA